MITSRIPLRKIFIFISIIISVAAHAAAVRDIAYPAPQRMAFKVETGNFETLQWYEGDSLFVRYAFDHSNNIHWEGREGYEMLQLPLAVGSLLPDLEVRVLEEAAFSHNAPDMPLYSLSPVSRFRENDVVYLTINPFRPNNRIVTRLLIEADFHRPAGKPTKDPATAFLLNSRFRETLAADKKTVLKKTKAFEGEWLDLTVSEEGIYGIRRSDLQQAGVQGEIGDNSVYLYAGKTFGSPLKDSFPDSSSFHLRQVPLLFLDAVEDADDQWVFYASPASAWKRSVSGGDLREQRFVRNAYESDQHFRLFIGSAGDVPLRMEQLLPQFGGTEKELAYGYRRIHDESEAINPGKGGELWLGERINGSLTRSFYLDKLYRSEDAVGALRVSVGVTTSGAHEFKTYLSDSLIYEVNFSNIKNADDYDYENSVNKKDDFRIPSMLLTEELDLRLQYRGEFTASEGFLDFVDLIYPVSTEAVNGYLQLWYPEFSEAYKTRVSGLGSSLSYVFSVEDPFRTSYFPVSGSETDIRIAPGAPVSFIILNESHFKVPASLRLLNDFRPENSADHGEQIDFVIITPDVFLTEAQRLADHKENRPVRPLNTMVKRYSEIIGQFNAGNRDPFAIRHFLANLYAQAPAPAPLYVLLLGDAHYDYQNRISANPVHIPYLYENNVMWPCDDIFVMVSSADDLSNDMAIGRIPASSLDEVQAVVDKIIEYDNREYPGEWQLNAMLVADDPTDLAQGPGFVGQTAFIKDSERLYEQYLPKVLQTKKLYLTEYPERYVTELQTMGRDGAREDLMEALLQGQAFVNFYGHGDASVWTQENVFIKNDLQRLEVNRQYPLIIAATCSWGRSDLPDFQSTAEEIVTLPENGAIATVATVRSVFHGSSSSANVKFVEDFLSGFFEGNPDYAYTPLLGDAMLYAKNRSNNTTGSTRINNNMKFMLFGDPTLLPAFPRHIGRIDSVGSDTLRALDRVGVSGTAMLRDSSIVLSDPLEGRITVYDNSYFVSREYVYDIYGSTTTLSYKLEGNRLFNGNIGFEQGRFETQIFIPKDIRYQGERGKIRLWYHNADAGIDGAAALDTIYVGGINPNAPQDVSGPEIVLYGDGKLLNNGAVVFDTSRIRIEFEDLSGINITGSGGHVLELRVDNGMQTLDLSTMFSYENNDYQNGSVEFPVANYLDEGEHLLEVSAFDNYNNYAQTQLTVRVLVTGTEPINDLVNFPNPFKDETVFTFSSAMDATAVMRIYTISGKPVVSIEDIPVSRGFNMLPWQAFDSHGYRLAAGVYFYVLRIQNGEESLRYHNKMLIMP